MHKESGKKLKINLAGRVMMFTKGELKGAALLLGESTINTKAQKHQTKTLNMRTRNETLKN